MVSGFAWRNAHIYQSVSCSVRKLSIEPKIDHLRTTRRFRRPFMRYSSSPPWAT
jgi:hypothetical protein